jgi:hypothetical protein
MNMLAVGLAVLSCATLYLSSQHQRGRAAPLPRGPARASAAMLACASFYAFSRVMNMLPAAFAFVTCTMLGLVVVPSLGAAYGAARRVR